MTLLDHARTELRAAADAEVLDDGIIFSLLATVEAFARQGHSGGSAAIMGPYVGEVLRRLLAYEPIVPLTGADDEWQTIAEDIAGRPGLQQNVRCSRVFREDGVAYDIEAVVFDTWRRGSFIGWDSARRVTFPYTPSTRRTRWRRASRLAARLRGQLRPEVAG